LPYGERFRVRSWTTLLWIPVKVIEQAGEMLVVILADRVGQVVRESRQ
jgi:hypothetical protein